MGAQTEDVVTYFRRRRRERDELLERVAKRIQEIVSETGPEGIYVIDLLNRAAVDEDVLPDDAGTALWQLVDRNELDYSLQARVTPSRGTPSRA